MKRINSFVFLFILFTFFSLQKLNAQSFGPYATAVWMKDCKTDNFFNVTNTRTPDNLIGPAANNFVGKHFGVHTQNSGTLVLRGAEVKTYKNVASSNVCGANLRYRIYQVSATPGSFSTIAMNFFENCDVGQSKFAVSGGPCGTGDQKWQKVIPDGSGPINLTTYPPGNYVIEVYFDVSGSFTSTTACDDVTYANNGANNYKAFFSIQAPAFASTNPTTCNGTEGTITISGLAPDSTYSFGYKDDGVQVGPTNVQASATGTITVTGLNAGTYNSFSLGISGCSNTPATSITLVNPVYTPTFDPIPAFCSGTTAPTLPATSTNGFTGTWNPATIDNQADGSYTFTPTAGQCAVPVTINVTVTPTVTPTFSFASTLGICGGASVPTLPTTSDNGVTGTWSPATVDNQNNGTYTFTPTTGQCANPYVLTVNVTPNVTPTFGFGTTLNICAGATVPSLPGTSQNSVTGTWSPAAIDNQNNGTYTFTPTAGQCATTATLTVTVTPNVTPTFSFGTTLTVCSGATVPTLPGTSQNSVTGTWSPATIDNQNNGTYTFTPTEGQCATTTTLTVTITPKVTPTFSFGTSLQVCASVTPPVLPTTSQNGVTGTWSPATIDNQNNGTYTFTPTAGLCANTVTLTVTATQTISPVFLFPAELTICAGSQVPSLPTTAENGITGTWSPATVDNQNNGTYTFTPAAGQCASGFTLTVTVTPKVTPTFSFGTSFTICAGSETVSLPGTSQNGITGTWNPSTIDNQNNGTYTFTPGEEQCATTATLTVTVTPKLTPAFSFGTALSICAGANVPSLPTNSQNGVAGSWSPSTIDNQNNGTYTFTPDEGQCANTTTLTVTVTPNVTPTFGFGSEISFCAGSTAPILPLVSVNNITGTWSPATINNQQSGTYTFTPAAGQCATQTTLSVTVNQKVNPTFGFGSTLTICSGDEVPSLPEVSNNDIGGSWSPSTINNQQSGTYTFTPNEGICANTFTLTVTVNQKVTAGFNFGTSLSICAGATVPSLPQTSANNVSGTWSPATINNQQGGTYTFTPSVGQCATGTTLTVTVNPIPTVVVRNDTTVYDGAQVPGLILTGTPGNVSFNWVNSNTSIGLGASGSGNVPSFTATNRGNDPITGTITVTPTANGCTGATGRYTITVRPLNKDVFVPNVFSPNGDGRNDVLFVYGNYITKLEFRIFNQWGEQMIDISNRSQGWDGTYKGKPQPTGVYVYVLRATLADGRTIDMKGSITLLR